MAALTLLKLQAEPGLDVVTQLRQALGANYGKVTDLFRDLDEDGNGFITRQEFARMLPMIGLGVSRRDADAFFNTLDADGSGEIDFAELNDKLRAGADVKLDEKLVDGAAGRIEIVSMNAAALRGGVLLNNLSSVLGVGAELHADNASYTVSEQLRDALNSNLARVIDLFHEWDANSDGLISKGEFRKALMVLGLRASSHEMDALFNEFDTDRGGFISYRELRTQLRRRYTDNTPKPPRPPIWAANPRLVVAKVPVASLMDDVVGAPAAVADAAASSDDAAAAAAAAGLSPSGSPEPKRLGDAPKAKIALARAEAVLLGQMHFLPAATLSMSQRRVRTLSTMTDTLDKEEIRRCHQQEREERRENTLASRLRGEKMKEAEGRQAAAITGMKVVPTASRSPGRVHVHVPEDEGRERDPLLNASSLSTIPQSPAVPKKGFVSLEDACFGGDVLNSTWQSVSSVTASRGRPKSQSAASLMNASSSSVASSASAVASNVASSQLIWQYDLAPSRPLESVCGQSALNCATTKSTQLGHRQSKWAGSLRRIDSLPSFPLPVRSEYVRAGLRKPLGPSPLPPPLVVSSGT